MRFLKQIKMIVVTNIACIITTDQRVEEMGIFLINKPYTIGLSSGTNASYPDQM
jgi:hypothetical protein